MSDSGGHLYTTNTIARWDALGFPALEQGEDVFARRTGGGGHFMPRRPVPAARIEQLLTLPVHGPRNVIEDVFGVRGVRVPDGVMFQDYPIMLRPADAVLAAEPGRDIEVLAASTPGELARAERTIVEGYPRSEVLPWTPGGFIPPNVLDDPRWQTWLALRSGIPAAGVVSYDDGESLGIYWLATMPEHRGAGLAAALMTSVLASAPERASVLVATRAGRPLYERLGYRAVADSRWYRVPA